MDAAHAISDPVAHALAWAEAHLDAPLSLDQLAVQAGLSPYHFSRLFTARMGASVMAHIRGRKLVRAARRLTSEPDLRLIELAFDSGFESQEAFTRAFKRTFGVSPGRFRKGFSVTPIEGQFPMTPPANADVQVAQLPNLEAREALSIAGFSRRFDGKTAAEIPQLWARLMGGLPFEGQAPSWDTFGVVWEADRKDGTFSYMAGVGLKADAPPPSGWDRLELPAATYAVFRITLNGGPLHPQVKAAMAKIWGEMIPESGLKLVEGPDFELYDGRFEPDRPGAVIDFHVPVAP